MHPILFQSKFFTIHTFWVLFAISVVASTYTIVKLSKRNNLKISFLSENSLKLLGISLLSARIASIILNYKNYFYEFSLSSLSSIFHIWDKGFNAWAGILAFFIYLFVLCKKEEQNFFAWLDILVPSILIGIAISNLGAFFEGINYGKETTLNWGVNFESPSIKYTVPIHPTQIYAFLYSLILASLLIIFKQNKKENEKYGIIGLIGVISYLILRFLEEFLRGDDAILIGNIRLAQITLLIAILISGIIFLIHYTQITKNTKKLKSNTKKK